MGRRLTKARKPRGTRRPSKSGARRPSVRRALSCYGGLQREADGAEGERHTRWWMCSPRPTENRRGNRRDAEIVVCCEYERPSRGLVLDQLQDAEQGNVITAELIAIRRRVVVRGVTDCVCRHGRLVRNRRYAVP